MHAMKSSCALRSHCRRRRRQEDLYAVVTTVAAAKGEHDQWKARAAAEARKRAEVARHTHFAEKQEV